MKTLLNARARNTAKICTPCSGRIEVGEQYQLTGENGQTVRRCKWCAQRNARNAAARARASALRSVGMVRTPYGWE